jgi:hypothetical protein
MSVRKVPRQNLFGIYVGGRLHSTYPTRRHAKKMLGGMVNTEEDFEPLFDFPPSPIYSPPSPPLPSEEIEKINRQEEAIRQTMESEADRMFAQETRIKQLQREQELLRQDQERSLSIFRHILDGTFPKELPDRVYKSKAEMEGDRLANEKIVTERARALRFNAAVAPKAVRIRAEQSRVRPTPYQDPTQSLAKFNAIMKPERKQQTKEQKLIEEGVDPELVRKIENIDKMLKQPGISAKQQQSLTQQRTLYNIQVSQQQQRKKLFSI